ncbi:MAG: type II secretion system minor pseudopilin GspJ [Pseudomonadales bacterium]|nr:type II secretion system minor pseudopilin GspJ [Pseudomonadales bacterium]
MISYRSQSGFTLIEMLLAVSITVIVAVMAFQGLDSAMQLSQRSEVEADRIHRLNRVFDILAKDFRQVIPRKVRSPDSNEFVDAFFYNASSQPILKFTKNGWTNPHAQRFQRSQLQRVNYHYDGEKLVRSSWPMLDRYGDSEATEITLLDKVESVRIRLLQQQVNNNGTNASGNLSSKTAWVESWPVSAGFGQSANTASVELPLAIEITLEVQGWGSVRRLFEFVDAGEQ